MNKFVSQPFLFFLCLLTIAVSKAWSDEQAQPNIVFIIADDLGWADVEFHGGNAPTPRLNQLAKESLELQNHYVAPVCSPTRAGFLTGRYWSRFGVTTPINTLALPPETITLPRALQSAGYQTCITGKWHLGSLPKWGPNHFGFDHSYGSLAGGISPWNHRYKKGTYSHTWHRDEVLREEQGHVTDLLTEEAIGWLRSRQEDPFFLYVPYTAVHLPLKEPKEWVDRVPAEIQGEVARHYAASIMHLDHCVGRILDTLKEIDELANTLVVFTSDNGGSTAENNDLKYPDDNCPNGRIPGNNLPLKGQKGTVYEGGIRVPTLVSWPGHIESGKSTTRVHVTDWMPTFCSLAGYEAEEDLRWDGLDLSQVLLDQQALPNRSIYTAGPNWRSRSLHYGDYKLIARSKGNKDVFELYNLKDDPNETTNLAAKEPQETQDMRELLAKAEAADEKENAKTFSTSSNNQSGNKTPLISAITKQTLWSNRDGKSRTWFHPRACAMPDENGKPIVLMNLQEIGGSDYFGQVHWSVTKDLGRTWSEPAPIEALGRDSVPGRSDDLKAGVCDVTPQYHPQTNSVIALGHVVFYKGEYFARKEQLARYPVYVTRSSDGTWSERKILEWDDPRGSFIYSNNCGQRHVLPNGDVQMSFTFGPKAESRMAAGVRCSFDGSELEIQSVGPALRNKAGRGLLEPSVTKFGDKFWMTLRAEDDRGYVTVSEDGLNWDAKKAWSWEDGTPIDMSTTQQHWLRHSDGLFLVYTRQDDSNRNVIRWRSPLWVAQVDLEKRCLIKATERVVLPLVGDGINKPNEVALMGNFDVTNVSPHESWITVGEWLPRSGYRGNVLLARVYWSKPNHLPLW